MGWLHRIRRFVDGEARSSGTLRARLLRSHFKLGLLGVALLLVGLGSTLWLRHSVMVLTEERGPAQRHAMATVSGVHQSVAQLRGWVLLGEEDHLLQRRRAWDEEIWPSLSALEALLTEDDPARQGDLQRTRALLRELHEWQWWIEDVAHLPGNEPARVLHRQNVEPIAGQLGAAIDSLHRSRLERPTPTALSRDLHELRFALQVSRAHLLDHLDSGREEEAERFRNHLRETRDRLAGLQTRSAAFDPEETRLLLLIQRELAAFEQFAEEALDARRDPRWNIARFWLSTEAAPRERAATDLLAAITAREQDRVAAETSRIELVSQLVVLISLVLIGAMAVASVRLSEGAARELTAPIQALARASDRMAAGEPVGDLPVTTDDEVGRLTETFNAMRSTLEERRDELRAFSYSVSHDLRAPVQTIEDFSRILEEEYGEELDDEGRRLLGLIRGKTKEMQSLMDGLLVLSRLEHVELHRVELPMDELVESTFQELTAPLTDREIRLELDDLPPAVGDPTLLREALSNLLSNAIKFTAPRDVAIIEVGASKAKEEVAYYVRDNGVGFDPRYEDSLFQVFKRLHPRDQFEGTGVGLAIVERIVRRHGGRVWAKGKKGTGATFFFTLPGPDGRQRGAPRPRRRSAPERSYRVVT